MLLALALPVAASLAACGGDDDSGGAAAATTRPSRRTSTHAGPITYVQGKDNTGVVAVRSSTSGTRSTPTRRSPFKEQTDEANQQHDDLVRNLQAQNADYDVVSVDLVWTAEFAAKG